MPATLSTPVTVSDTTTGTDATITGLPATPAGDHLIVGTLRQTLTGDTNGVAALDVDTNAEVVNEGHAARAATLDVGLHIIPISDAVEANDSLLVRWSTTGNGKKAASAVPAKGIANPTARNARSAFTLGLGETSTGSNGASTTPAGGDLTTAGAGEKLVVAVVGFGGLGTTISAHPTDWTPLGGIVAVDNRNMQLYYRHVTGAATVSISGMTLSASVGWAIATVAWEVKPPRFVVDETGAKVNPVSRFVVDSTGAKVTLDSLARFYVDETGAKVTL